MPELLSVEEARALVLARVPPPRVVRLPLAGAAGRVLAQEIRSDRDHPPFRRSRVDGYAVRSADCSQAGASLRVVAEVPAGSMPDRSVGTGEAARIFTGAPVPDGADAVVMQEDCERDQDGVRVGKAVAPGACLVPRGHECAAAATVLRAGDVVTPSAIGVAASVGASAVDIFAAPRARVVATGDELVPVEATPGPAEIRNGNGPVLTAALSAAGAKVDGARHAADTPESHRDALSWALKADVVVTTGGVSVGDHDLVPSALDDLGVEKVLHGVRQQPGKPFWFGVRGDTLVFGLPGNPVSALVTHVLFVVPALRKWTGREPGPRTVRAKLMGDLAKGKWRRRHDPVHLAFGSDGGLEATPVRFAGSGDIFGFTAANGLAVVPENAGQFVAGDAVDVIALGTLGALAQ